MENLRWASSGGDSASEVLFLIFDHDQSRSGDWACSCIFKLLKIKCILKAEQHTIRFLCLIWLKVVMSISHYNSVSDSNY